jgi:uncharacterized tellurite resistance protein B-like protein
MTERTRRESGLDQQPPPGVPAPWERRFPERTAAANRGEALVATIAVVGLVVVGVAVLVIDGDRTGAAIAAGAAVLLLAIAGALRRMRRNVAAEAARHPIVTHYRLLVELLVKVMAADRTLDQREREAVRGVCDSLRIAPALRERFIDAALEAERREGPREALETLAARYLELSERAGLLHARRTAMMAALVVARADGVVAEAEEAVIRALGAALGASEAETASLLAQHRVGEGAIEPALARAVLGLGEAASADDVEAAARTLLDDLRPDDYGHIGRTLADYAAERRGVIERARLALGAGDSSPP